MSNIDIEKAVFKGIRKTINRFREKPFHYFTEADIHSSLLNDMMIGASNVLSFKPSYNNTSVSLVHQEYPTNFRFIKEALIHGYNKDSIINTYLNFKNTDGKSYGRRGHFDLAILNKNFALNMLKQYDLQVALGQIINKDNEIAKKRIGNCKSDFQKELLYAIEVKFIHNFNARHINMLNEVVKDDNKLHLAYMHSNGFIKPINLIFCSTPEKKSRGGIKPVVKLIRDYVEHGSVIDRNNNYFRHPNEILTIFIESFIGDKKVKETQKPLVGKSSPSWAHHLISEYNQTN